LNKAKLTWQKFTLQLRNPFRLSYGVSETRQAYWIRLADDEGWGEGTIPPYYGVKDADMITYWERMAQSRQPFPDDPADIPAWVGTDGPAPARCALELALYDRIARQQGLALYALLGLPKPVPMATSFTIAIDTPEAMAEMARKIAKYPIIKVKLGSEDDEARLAAIRQARPDALLRIDANAGWTLEESLRHVAALEQYDLELIEQPNARHEIEAMGEVQRHTTLPIVADESVQTMEDIERLGAAGVRGINLKLMKVGGLTNGLKILKRAGEFGMRIMLGQMVETSLGTTAMGHLTGLAEWVDLDGPLLISNDPFTGIQYDEQAVFTVPDEPGMGVKLREG
jgi:L-alanine-DL-glutamate epimerase-like enolase superfamily enzyme